MNTTTVTQPKRQDRTQNLGLTPYSGAWGEDQIIHLLRRTMFGVKRSDVVYFKTKTMTQAVNELLNVNLTPAAPPVNTYSDLDAAVPIGQTFVNAPRNNTYEGARRAAWKTWKIGQLIGQDRSILEKMWLFWHNHFATETNDITDSRYVYKHHELLRANSLGNFKSLVRQVTTDPAMLVYLNGRANNKTAPDENYGRELQELFTLGKGPDSKYTEADVKAAAKVLTGWQENNVSISSLFNANRHDTTNKQFSAFYNNTVIAGVTGVTGGATELDAMLNMIFAQPEVAKFIARKVYTFFVYYTIDADVETNIIEPLADIFRNSGYEIKPMIDALLKSEHFFDTANKGCVIRSPLDFLIGTVRTLNIAFPTDSPDAINQYKAWRQILGIAIVLQQDPGDPPNVAGWAAYYQMPQYHEIWINSSTLPNRNKTTDGFVAGINVANTGGAVKIKVDAVAFAESLPNATNPNLLIDEATKLLHGVSLSTASKNAIKFGTLNANQAADTAWTTAWNAYVADPTNATKKSTVNTRLNGLLIYIMRLSEFQLS